MTIAFAEKLHEYVHFPKTVEGQRRNIRKFYEIAQFPNVAACIDGTLIKIANPNKEFGENFRSRKGTFSLNILVILIIIYIATLLILQKNIVVHYIHIYVFLCV